MQQRLEFRRKNNSPDFDTQSLRGPMQLIQMFGHCLSVYPEIPKSSRLVEFEVVSPFVQHGRPHGNRIAVRTKQRHHEIYGQSVTVSFVRRKFAATFLTRFSIHKFLLWRRLLNGCVSSNYDLKNGTVHIGSAKQPADRGIRTEIAAICGQFPAILERSVCRRAKTPAGLLRQRRVKSEEQAKNSSDLVCQASDLVKSGPSTANNIIRLSRYCCASEIEFQMPFEASRAGLPEYSCIVFQVVDHRSDIAD